MIEIAEDYFQMLITYPLCIKKLQGKEPPKPKQMSKGK